jgi:hypothetical protein
MCDQVWRAEPVPAETVAAVRAELDPLIETVIAAVREESPVYGPVMSGPEGVGIRLGIEQAIRAFLEAAQDGRRPAGETDELWRRLGEAEFQAGRSLDDLRAAFRTGIRAAWRGAADLATRAGVSAPIAIALAEAIFIYGDELTTDVVEGYLRMQSDQAGERERRRRRLAQLLLDPAGADAESLQHAAELARWPVPRKVAVLALATEDPGAISRHLDVDALAGVDTQGAWLILPDPGAPGRTPVWERALAEAPAVLGPTVDASDAHSSLRWARMVLELVGDGILPGHGLVRVRDHLADLILLQDRGLAAELVCTRLAPLDGIPTAERERLQATLGAWLDHQRHTPGVAAQLHVHPQTVRYRMAKLRELFGGALDTPEGRFELSLALRARRAVYSSATGGG